MSYDGTVNDEQRKSIEYTKNQICIECTVCKMPTILIKSRLRMCSSEEKIPIWCGYCGKTYQYNTTNDEIT